MLNGLTVAEKLFIDVFTLILIDSKFHLEKLKI